MLYRISYGPAFDRQTETFESIAFAVDCYRQLADANALNIELFVEGMPLDPQSLLKACPREAQRPLFNIDYAKH